MNISRSLLVYLILSMMRCYSSQAQSTFQLGTLPAVNLNKSFPSNWGLNLKWEARQVAVPNLHAANPEVQVDGILSDFSAVVSKKVGLQNALAGGYLLRLRSGQRIHRAIQQFTLLDKQGSLRMAHRITTDQTFEPQEPVELRLRYRFTAEVPLNGTSADPKEFYFKVNQEQLNSWQSSDYDLEFRLVPQLGYIFSDDNKVEAGVDYRINSFIRSDSRSALFLNVSWFLKI